MQTGFTKEQLERLDKDLLIQLLLSQQQQLKEMDEKLQKILEQLADNNRRRFGRSTERMDIPGQMTFYNANGELIYLLNDAEAIADQDPEAEPEDAPARKRPGKRKGKREEDLRGLPVIPIEHTLSDEELRSAFGTEGWRQLPDEVYRRYHYVPSEIKVEEHHVAVYEGLSSKAKLKAKHPAYLFRNSLASPSIAAAVIDKKYDNALPLYRIEQDFKRRGINISRQDMAHWMINCSNQYLSLLYDYLHEKIHDYHVLQADETPVLVTKDGRDAGSKSYMWVYRTGASYLEKPIVLYEYQKTRNASHPREFLKGFHGICITDGYQVYHTLEAEREDLRIAGCWAHARRRFDEAVKAMPKDQQKDSVAYLALKQIQSIFREEKYLADLSPQERQKQRELLLRPKVEAYFAWAKQNIDKVLKNSKTWKGLNYSINQEKYLKVFLEDGEVPMDNNAAERTIRGFCIGKKNWIMIDTISGAKASAVLYSLVETAKANNLKPYEYFKYLLEQIPEHGEFEDRSYLEDLLPWSDKLPEECRQLK